jgi:hypothetical protein
MGSGCIGVWDCDFFRLTEATGIVEGFDLTSNGPKIWIADGLGFLGGFRLQGGYELDLTGEVGWLVLEAGPWGLRAGRLLAGGGLELFCVWSNGATLGAARDMRRRLWVVEASHCLDGPAGGVVIADLGAPTLIRRVQAALLRHDEADSPYWQTTLATVAYDAQETLTGLLRATVHFDKPGDGTGALLIEGYEMA